MKFATIMSLFLSSFLQAQYNSGSYKLLKTIEQIEIRQYSPQLFVSYSEKSDNSSFRVLANYIFGGNKDSEEIAMTSPVVIKLYKNNEMLFLMPAKYSRGNLPEPNDKNIKIVESPKTNKAVITYSGYSNSSKENRYIKELKQVLKDYGIKHNNMFELFVYDPPYKLINRRNEIAVNIQNGD